MLSNIHSFSFVQLMAFSPNSSPPTFLFFLLWSAREHVHTHTHGHAHRHACVWHIPFFLKNHWSAWKGLSVATLSDSGMLKILTLVISQLNYSNLFYVQMSLKMSQNVQLVQKSCSFLISISQFWKNNTYFSSWSSLVYKYYRRWPWRKEMRSITTTMKGKTCIKSKIKQEICGSSTKKVPIHMSIGRGRDTALSLARLYYFSYSW